MTLEIKILAILMILLAASYGWFFHSIPAIGEWERANSYPLGLHCELWSTCKEPTK
jgi:hypothetical protein